MTPIQLNARKPLADLAHEWRTCTSCRLGQRRHELHLNTVVGTGTPRGIMFIGEGPGWQEELAGEPFVGKSGQLLSDLLTQWNLTRTYFTNLVACRSCSPRLNPDGTVRMTFARNGFPPEPQWSDEPPLPAEVEACRPRLMEEIYLVDPFVVVTLGARALEGITQRPVPSIQAVRGKPISISVPGLGQTPVLTEKRQQWHRKVRGEWVAPTETTGVTYLCIPTVHPSFVLRKLHDDRTDQNPLRAFARDIYAAVTLYRRALMHFERVVEHPNVAETPIDELTNHLQTEMAHEEDG